MANKTKHNKSNQGVKMIEVKDMHVSESDKSLVKDVAKDILGYDITDVDATVACYRADQHTGAAEPQDWLDYVKQYFIG